MIVTDFAIVLGTRKYGDTSKIVSLYTKSNGKLSLMVKGARNFKSKFGSTLEPLSFNKVSYYLYHNKDLHLLSTSEYQHHFKKLNESFDHLTSGLAILESISLTQDQYLKNEELFDLIVNYLEYLNELNQNPYSAYLKFQISLMNILGFGLIFDRINMEINDNFVYINIDKGESDSSSSVNSFKMFKMNFNKMEYLAKNSLENSSKVEFDSISMQSINSFINKYFQFHLDKSYFINSLGII